MRNLLELNIDNFINFQLQNSEPNFQNFNFNL